MTDKTTEALKLSTVALKDIACTSQTDDLLWWQIRAREALAAISEALAEQSLGEYHGKLMREVCNKVITETLAEQEKQEKQEPVGMVKSSEEWGVAGVLIAGLPIGTKLYAAPVKRDWVELEPSQLCEIEERIGLPIDSHDFETIGNAYIAAFKEKNK